MKRITTGFRPTGKLHIGHYFGNVANLLRLQSEFDCFLFIVDWHALTTDYKDTSKISENINEVALDLLSAGIDPDRCTLYRQSDIHPIAELFLYFSMITPLSWLFRCPTYKEQVAQLKDREIQNMGFLGYPVLQAADITIVHGEVVPVGEDQLPHLELTREIVRRFNFIYGEYFKEPEAMVSEAKRVPGIDGRKMSKSYENAIFLSDEPDEMLRKISRMMTDPQRIYLKDPGHPDVCPVFAVYKLYYSDTESVRDWCENARVGCTECKKRLAEKIIDFHAGFRVKRKEILGIPDYVMNVLSKGCERALDISLKTIAEVKKLIKIS
jgi:tryptophanyl-tRNA synthetase